MTSVPRWEPDGTESPAERTDPLLPAITDDMLPPLGLPKPPTLDDRSLAQMLAELEGDDADLVGDGNPVDESPAVAPDAQSDPTADVGSSQPTADVKPAEPTADPCGPTAKPGDPGDSAVPTADPAFSKPQPVRDRPVRDRPARNLPVPLTGQTPAEPPLRLVEHPGSPVGYRSVRGPVSSTRATAAGGTSTGRYVRRDLRPPEVDPDALSLTGLTRRLSSRIGSLLFRVAFVGIFLLILIQAIVSLLTPGS